MPSSARIILTLLLLLQHACLRSNDGQRTGVSALKCPDNSELTYDHDIAPFMARYCTNCHASNLVAGERDGAPLGHDFDTQAGVLGMAKHIADVAAAGPGFVNTGMPIGDEMAPTVVERTMLGEWLACNADLTIDHDHDHDHGDGGHPQPPMRSDGGFVERDSGADDPLRLPPNFPNPLIPLDNPLTLAKVELGRRLFYDPRISVNDQQSCGSCHLQHLAFTDGRAQSLGTTGEVHPRSSMSLTNVVYSSVLTWASPIMDTLERQTLVPMFGREPVELGLVDEESFVLKLRAIAFYQDEFARAYPDESEPINLKNSVNAMTSFERTLISGRSPYDRWLAGQDDAISESAKRGFELFNGHPFECFHCHGGFNFSDSVMYEGNADGTPQFHNTGLYNMDGNGSYPVLNRGLFELSDKPDDMGRFRAPTLRNVAVTAPYMHDGSIATLSDVLDHYAAGGRTIPADRPNAGEGHSNPYKSPLVLGFPITEQERADVIAFLESLTDEVFLNEPRFSNPWQEDAGKR